MHPHPGADPLREAQSQLQTANADLFIDAAAQGIAVLHIDGTVLRVNPAFCRIFGFSPEDLQARYLDELIVPADKIAESREFRRAALRGPHVTITTQRRHRGGGMLEVVISGAPIDAGQGAIGIIVLFRDITDQRTLEHQLLESQKMEAIGRLVGSVSHDFNNLLTAIMVYCGLLKENLAQNDSARQHADEIFAAAEQGSELVRQLLSIARQRRLEPKLVSLAEVVDDLGDMLQRLIGEDVQMQVVADRMAGLVEVDRAQVQQAILNLALNARDAMPTGGRLLVRTAQKIIREYSGKEQAVPAGEYVVLSVEDTGCGMDAATRSRIFEPFFSTKPQGKGTGLGLASVYAIVTQAGGHITVSSRVGEGSRFELYFPQIASVSSAISAAASESEITRNSGSETVLLVEDQDRVRAGLAEALEKNGYRVLAARHAEEALQLSHSHRDRIDLLLTDMVMPGLGGDQLAEQILKFRPDIRIMFMSGYNLRPVTLLRHGRAAFAEKPLQPAVLLRSVRDLLDQVA
jgi:two-component system, cell cycle sensor histidine kinase and response regulator CckA